MGGDGGSGASVRPGRSVVRDRTIAAMRPTVSLAAALIAIVVLLRGVAAAEQPAPASVPVQAPVPVLPPQGHGWLAWRDAADRWTMVLHLPPRAHPGAGEAQAGSPSGGAADGAVRLAPGVAQVVDDLAWWNHRAYMLLQEDRTAPIERADWLRRIVGLTAVRSAVTAPGQGNEVTWQYPPGRPVVVATMKARSREVLAFGACRWGPVVLVRHGPRGE